MGKVIKLLKKMFWKLPLPGFVQEKIRRHYAIMKFAKEELSQETVAVTTDMTTAYSRYILESPTRKYEGACEYEEHSSCKQSAILIAYYLTQYAPDPHNDLWWGKGTTEWNNVSKAQPQFVGHRQPLLPGELGFYDLRIKENMKRQIEIAKNYGIDVFDFYFYWFAGERILEKPLDMFLEDESLCMPFMFCWANESWTRRYSGVNESVLIGMDETEDNYKDFIHAVIPYFSDPRYFKVDGRIALQIYRPASIPNAANIIEYWRSEVKKECGYDLYLIATQERDGKTDWCKVGFDAENEWMMVSIRLQCKDITDKLKPIRKDFSGEIFDYEDLVNQERYYISRNRKKIVYPAVAPSWDNTARRNHRGTIFYNSTPALYKRWLSKIILEVNARKEFPAPLVFINAWNEWGEGAYLEPDRDYGYAYLQATWEAKNEYNG